MNPSQAECKAHVHFSIPHDTAELHIGIKTSSCAYEKKVGWIMT